MDVKELVAQLRALVEGARAMPMSASVVINRSEILDIVAKLEAVVPTAFGDRQQLDDQREEIMARARQQAAEIVADAERERERLLSDTDVWQAAKEEADGLRRETDDYVDTRLATFEVTLTKTLDAVRRGRSRLQGRNDFDALGDGDPGAVLTTPDELRPSPGDRL